jgi:hypothetical protein
MHPTRPTEAGWAACVRALGPPCGQAAGSVSRAHSTFGVNALAHTVQFVDRAALTLARFGAFKSSGRADDPRSTRRYRSCQAKSQAQPCWNSDIAL